MHARFDAQTWATTLGWAGASVTDRKYLSVYRYVAYFHDVLDLVGPREAAIGCGACDERGCAGRGVCLWW